MVSMMAGIRTILKVFVCYLLPNCKLAVAETWWKASGQHGDLELLKWFRSDIKDSHHGSYLDHLENFQITSAPHPVVSLIELKLDGRYWGVMKIQNC